MPNATKSGFSKINNNEKIIWKNESLWFIT